MGVCSSFTQHRLWRTLLQELKHNEEDSLTDRQQDSMIEDNLNGFVGWLMLHVGSVGTHARKQLFYFTFMCQFHGLSRDGVDLMSEYGYGQALRTYDSVRQDTINRSDAQTRYPSSLLLLIHVFADFQLTVG
jgi:hypothetical protein